MASAFKNAGMTVGVVNSSAGNLYTCPGGSTAVIHALYISNKSNTNQANVDVMATIDGGSTFKYIIKSASVDFENTLVLDKPINLEASDVLRVVAEYNIDSSLPDVECFASILEVS